MMIIIIRSKEKKEKWLQWELNHEKNICINLILVRVYMISMFLMPELNVKESFLTV